MPTRSLEDLNPDFFPISGGFSSGSGFDTTGPYPDRALPSWLPTSGEQIRELESDYGNVRQAFDTTDYSRASAAAQGHLATTAMNAANNAATEYTNRTRQAGGSGAGAGLIRAQGQVGAQSAIADMKLRTAEFEIKQREAAAAQSAQIAATIGSLRSDYLKSLVSYTTSEDKIAADWDLGNRQLDAAGGSRGDAYNYVPGPFGEFSNVKQFDTYLQKNAGRATPYGRWKPPTNSRPNFNFNFSSRGG